MGRDHQVSTTGKDYEETAFVKQEGEPWDSELKEMERMTSSAGLKYMKMGKQQGRKIRLIEHSELSFELNSDLINNSNCKY